MIGIIAESDSDIETLCVLLSRLCPGCKLSYAAKRGLRGSGNILREGAKVARLFKSLGVTRLLVCTDADGNSPQEIAAAIRQRIAADFDHSSSVVVVPVQMIEAWLLADPPALMHAIERMTIREVSNPESVPNPKHLLAKASMAKNAKPRYVSSIHNKTIAKHINLDAVARKCQSFGALREFATTILAESNMQ